MTESRTRAACQVYKSPRHAARAFAERYGLPLGQGWYRFRRMAGIPACLQGLDNLADILVEHRYALPRRDGRCEMDWHRIRSLLKYKSNY